MEPYLNRRQLLVYLALVLITLAVASQFLSKQESSYTSDVAVSKVDSSAFKLTKYRDSVATLLHTISTLENRIREEKVDSSAHEVYVDGKLSTRDVKLSRASKETLTVRTIDTFLVTVKVHDTTKVEVAVLSRADSSASIKSEVRSQSLKGFVGISGASSISKPVPEAYVRASVIKTFGLFYLEGEVRAPVLELKSPGVAVEAGIHF